MDNKVEITLDALSLLQIYSSLSDFMTTTGYDKCETNLNFALLHRAFTELEKEFYKIFNEEYLDKCADEYDHLKKVFHEKRYEEG